MLTGVQRSSLAIIHAHVEEEPGDEAMCMCESRTLGCVRRVGNPYEIFNPLPQFSRPGNQVKIGLGLGLGCPIHFVFDCTVCVGSGFPPFSLPLRLP